MDRMLSTGVPDVITDFGDAAVLLPAAVCIFAYLWFRDCRPTAVAWAATVALSAMLTIASKIVSYSCAIVLSVHQIRSPSGHMSLSTTFYGAVALLLTWDRKARPRWLVILAAATLVAAIGGSRVITHAHTTAEVAVGFAIGLLCVGLFVARQWRRTFDSLPWGPALSCVLLLMILLHGRHLRAEELLGHLASKLSLSTGFCSPVSSSQRFDNETDDRSQYEYGGRHD